MKIEHVIFDWSGTLYDDHVPSFASTRETVRHFSGKKISYSEYKKHFEIPVDRFYRRYDKKTSIAEIDRYYFQAFARQIHKGKLFSGVLKTLNLLKKNRIGMSVFSTVRQDLLDESCGRLGLKKYFQRVGGSVFDKTRELKKHIKILGLNPERTLFIGDMAHDVDAANHHGLLSGCVLNGYHPLERLARAFPHFVWQNQNDWNSFFQSLFMKTKKKKTARDHPVATVGALVFNRNGEALLVLTPKWGYTYGIPGGKIDYLESSRAAVIRELREETGLKIRPGELFVVQDSLASPEFYLPQSHFLLLNYLATADSTRVKLNDEAVSYLWVEPELALGLNLNHPTRILIEAYLHRVQ